MTQLLANDRQRMTAITLLATLNLPDSWIAAGFLRNLAWDEQHGQAATPLNDIDVLFFDPTYQYDESQLKQHLQEQAPQFDWDVKNQARMHVKNQHGAYQNSEDAMSFWPEKETAVAVRLLDNGQLAFLAPFGLARLFQNTLSHNPKREKALFEQRVKRKKWLHIWPKLQIVSTD